MDDLPDPYKDLQHAVHGDSIDVTGTDKLPKIPKTSQQREKLFQQLKQVGSFERHDDASIHDIIDFCKLRKFRKGEVVFKQGDMGDHFYIVNSGEFDVKQNLDNGLRNSLKYKGCGVFGEVALYYPTRRVATVIAATDGATLFELERKIYRTYASRKAYRRSKFIEEAILKVKEFKVLTPDELVRLADAMRPKNFPKGATLFREGDKPDGFYIVEKGNLIKFIDGKRLSTLKAGDYFGDHEMFEHVKRCYTVKASSPVTVAFVTMGIVERLLGPLDELRRRSEEEHAVGLTSMG